MVRLAVVIVGAAVVVVLVVAVAVSVGFCPEENDVEEPSDWVVLSSDVCGVLGSLDDAVSDMEDEELEVSWDTNGSLMAHPPSSPARQNARMQRRFFLISAHLIDFEFVFIAVASKTDLPEKSECAVLGIYP